MDEIAIVIMGVLIFISFIGYVVVWWLFPEWVGMSGKPSSTTPDGSSAYEQTDQTDKSEREK